MEGVLRFIILCCLISLGYEYSDISNVAEEREYIRTTKSDKYFRKTAPKLKSIFLWNSFSYMPYFNLEERGQMPFQKYGCPVNNCFVNARSALDDDKPVEEYDAVLFHMYGLEWLPLPKQRKWHQRYVFLSLESPQNIIMQRDYKYFFNWTMTYRRDSDIWWPFGSLTSRSSSKDDPISANFHLIQPQFDTNERTVFDLYQKKYLVAWFVSRCLTPGGREKYASELKKYIPIHIYGICGTYSCSEADRTSCLEQIDRDYKFYLSFENSICKDYVSEKLFDIIKYNVVPIVYGGANYSEILPPMSYINVADFSTPQDLADYLLYLDKNPDEYVKYFWWKSYYRIQESRALCKLCEMLHNSSLPHKVYPDVKEWWEGEGICKIQHNNTGIEDFALLCPRIKMDNNIWHENDMFLNQFLYCRVIMFLVFLLFSLHYSFFWKVFLFKILGIRRLVKYMLSRHEAFL